MVDTIREGADMDTYFLTVDSFDLEDRRNGESYRFIPEHSVFIVDDTIAERVYGQAGRESQSARLSPSEWTDEFKRLVFESLVEYGRQKFGVDEAYGQAVIPTDAEPVISSSHLTVTIEAELWSEKTTNITRDIARKIEPY